MTPLLLTCTCLLLPCCVPVTRSSNELQFYRDGVADVADGVALRELARYLESQQHRDRTLPFSDLSPFLMRSPHKKYHLERDEESDRHRYRALPDEAALAGVFRQGKMEDWNDEGENRAYGLMEELQAGRKGYDYDKPYYGRNLLPRMNGYTEERPPSKLYFPTTPPDNEALDLPDQGNLPYRIQLPWQHHKGRDSFHKSPKDPPLYYSHFHHHQDAPSNPREPEKYFARPLVPEFTFRFDDSNLGDKHPFAVKPNDPRYYRDSAYFSDPRENNEGESRASGLRNGGSNSWNSGNWELFPADAATPVNDEGEPQHFEEDVAQKTMNNKFKDISILAINDLNNDIYFIAIVAGCSAAAMFTLVLISLTWCRLQRGAKAAADIEYPAYGVTGPNKDVSPSGDQRLAHSAQMYHFQHQKQQIIAMESRASAGRDPGSVSEAESDEENDEGHHTVYECPGLASTGELEVKNPLFQDDSMPITPAQSTKGEERI